MDQLVLSEKVHSSLKADCRDRNVSRLSTIYQRKSALLRRHKLLETGSDLTNLANFNSNKLADHLTYYNVFKLPIYAYSNMTKNSKEYWDIIENGEFSVIKE